jgi:hypothetical protein
MITTTILRLRKASIWPQDFGSRYAQLLELLWQRTDPDVSGNSQPRTRTQYGAAAPSPNQHQTSLQQAQESHPPGPTGSTSFNHQSDFFSWLDLQAVGDAVSGDQGQVPSNGLQGSSSGVDGIQQLLDGATRRASVAHNAAGNFNNPDLNIEVAVGDPNLAWLFEDDLAWPDDEYSNLLF